jgi:hypothetical protein
VAGDPRGRSEIGVIPARSSAAGPEVGASDADKAHLRRATSAAACPADRASSGQLPLLEGAPAKMPLTEDGHHTAGRGILTGPIGLGSGQITLSWLLRIVFRVTPFRHRPLVSSISIWNRLVCGAGSVSIRAVVNCQPQHRHAANLANALPALLPLICGTPGYDAGATVRLHRPLHRSKADDDSPLGRQLLADHVGIAAMPAQPFPEPCSSPSSVFLRSGCRYGVQPPTAM